MPRSDAQARPRAIRMVVVEPYVLVRAALRGMVSWDSDIEIVAEVDDIDAAIAVLRGDPADVVLVDAEIRGASIVAGLQRLKRESPGSGVILLGHRRDEDELLRAVAAGAAAHVLDTVRPTVLADTIRAVADGDYLIDPSVAARPVLARRVLEAFSEASLSASDANRGASEPALQRLSAHEIEIFSAISQGMSNREIAAQFGTSPHSMTGLMKGVLCKLALNNRTRAVLAGMRRTLVTLPEEPICRLG